MSHRLRRQKIRRALPFIVVFVLLAVAVVGARETSRLHRSYEGISGDVVASPELVGELTGLALDEPRIALVVMAFGDEDPALPGVAFGLLRLDASAERSWLVGLPPEAAIDSSSSPDGFADAYDKGAAALVLTVGDVCGVAVDHYARIDVEGLAHWIGERGGIAVPEQPATDSGGAVGSVLADADQVMAYLRVDNGADMTLERYRRTHLLLRAVAAALREESGLLSRAGAVEQAAEWIATDMTGSDLRAAVRALSGDQNGESRTAVVPVQRAYRGATIDVESLAGIIEAFEAGEELPASLSEGQRIDPATVTVTVHNGAGIGGVAAEAAAILTAAGFPVGPVANANQFVYDTTLVVYRDDALAADRVLRELPVGRPVPSRGMYLFYTDVLVVVGRDWPQTQ